MDVKIFHLASCTLIYFFNKIKGPPDKHRILPGLVRKANRSWCYINLSTMLIRRNQWKCFSQSVPSIFRAVPIIFFLVQIKVSSWWCVNYLSWVILNTIYLDRTGTCFFGFQTSCLVHCLFEWCVSEVVVFAVLLFGFSFCATVQKVLCYPV